MNSVVAVNETSMWTGSWPAAKDRASINNVHLIILVGKFAIASSILLGYCLL